MFQSYSAVIFFSCLLSTGLLSAPTTSQAASPFIRGDVDTNGVFDLTDARRALTFIFLGDPVDCQEAVDVNGDGILEVGDPLTLLRFLFGLGPSPALPFPSCGLTSDTALGCAVHYFCEMENLPCDENHCPIVPEKELFITDLSVVEDPCRTTWNPTCTGGERGAWTFGKLMASLAGLPSVNRNPGRLSDFVLDWLGQIGVDQEINGTIVKGRSGVRPFVDKWAQISGFEDAEDPDLILDMTRAPFRLLSIVSRLDLRVDAETSVFGRAGESRFVFGFLDIDLENPDDPDQWFSSFATVIFEYHLPASECADLSLWAERWHVLGSLPFGDEFNKVLQDITDGFAGFNADPNRVNGSSLAQLRTNEVQFDDPWELREFHLSASRVPKANSTASFARLIQSTVAQTMDLRHQGSKLLQDYVASEKEAIENGRHQVPESFDGQPFAAGSALLPSPIFSWEVPGFECTEARQTVSFNTCNGCHGGETGTFFLHVERRSAGREARLSGFLTGVAQPDPDCFPQDPLMNTTTRTFNDLQRRARDLQDILRIGCSAVSDEAATAEVFSTPNRSTTVH